MEIAINDGKQDLIIRGGSRDFELCQKRSRDGVTVLEPFAFYGDLSALFSALLKMKVINSEATSLHELKEVILAAKADLTNIWALNIEGV